MRVWQVATILSWHLATSPWTALKSTQSTSLGVIMKANIISVAVPSWGELAWVAYLVVNRFVSFCHVIYVSSFLTSSAVPVYLSCNIIGCLSSAVDRHEPFPCDCTKFLRVLGSPRILFVVTAKCCRLSCETC